MAEGGQKVQTYSDKINVIRMVITVNNIVLHKYILF